MPPEKFEIPETLIRPTAKPGTEPYWEFEAAGLIVLSVVGASETYRLKPNRRRIYKIRGKDMSLLDGSRLVAGKRAS